MKKPINVLQMGIISEPIKVESHEFRRRTGGMKQAKVEKPKKIKQKRNKVFVRPNYSKYMKSKKWKGRRLAYLIKMGRKCAVCEEKKNLHVHHLSYENLGRELDRDLIILCEFHHDSFHERYGVKRDSKQETYKFIEEEQETEELRQLVKNL